LQLQNSTVIRWKTFVVDPSLPFFCYNLLSEGNYFTGRVSQLPTNPRKPWNFSTSNNLQYMVFAVLMWNSPLYMTTKVYTYNYCIYTTLTPQIKIIYRYILLIYIYILTTKIYIPVVFIVMVTIQEVPQLRTFIFHFWTMLWITSSLYYISFYKCIYNQQM